MQKFSELKFRDMLESKISRETPLTRLSIVHQIQNKIRTYMNSISSPSSPRSPKRITRSPLRKNTMPINFMLLSYKEPKDIVMQSNELKKIIYESVDEKNVMKLLQSTYTNYISLLENSHIIHFKWLAYCTRSNPRFFQLGFSRDAGSVTLYLSTHRMCNKFSHTDSTNDYHAK
jgi:hypothetical protein